MNLRDILLVTGSGMPVSAARFAARLARRHDAHLTGLFAASPVHPIATEGDGMILKAVQRRQEEEAARAQAMFERCLDEAGIRERSEWRQETGDPVETARRVARHADLVVVPQVSKDEFDALSGARPEDLLFGSGRPVLLVPRFGEFESAGERRVLIAWNGSPEASRAVHDAFPFLANASEVTILAIDPEAGTAGRWSQEELARHLARHGFKVTLERTASGGLPAGDILLNFAADSGADLLVMGGYGHSRLREFVFGGATRTILESATLPVLMSH